MSELSAQMPAAELAEWMAYASLEPFGEERADLRSAIVCATVANASVSAADRRRPFLPEDFLPGPFGAEAEEERQANEAALEAWQANEARRALRKHRGC